MSDRLGVKDSVGVEVIRKGSAPAPVADGLMPQGKFILEHWRNGKRINEYHFHNLVTNEGKNRMFNTLFKGTAQIANWYVGLISNTSYVALAAGDDYADIGQTANQWKEFTTYTDNVNSGNATTRPAWAAASASAQAITNSTPAIFDITTGGTVKGAFISSGQTKGDHTAGGVLWAEGLFSSGDSVVAQGDQLKLTYSVGA
jgi:hypothetical protein